MQSNKSQFKNILTIISCYNVLWPILHGKPYSLVMTMFILAQIEPHKWKEKRWEVKIQIVG